MVDRCVLWYIGGGTDAVINGGEIGRMLRIVKKGECCDVSPDGR